MDKKLKVLLLLIPLLAAALVGNFYKERDSYWNAVPAEGLISGDYYRVERGSREAGSASLLAVTDRGRILKVEYNEVAGTGASSRYFQGLSKRLSEYNFYMMREGDAGVSWAEVFLHIEEQMVENQSLTERVDTIAGATHSIDQSLLPLAESLEKQMAERSGVRYYELTKNMGGGIYGNLRVTVENGRITSCRYDELLASSKGEIIYKDMKKFYRQSKYHSMEYRDPSGKGFNLQMDSLNERVVSTQDLLDIEGLPATEDDPHKGRERSPAWDNYLVMAKLLSGEMEGIK